MKKLFLPIAILLLCNIVCGQSGFRGAELSAKMKGPGKLVVMLQAFYDADALIPATEKVLLLESRVTRTIGTIELKKIKEDVYDKYPPLGTRHKTAIHSCTYSAEFEVGMFRTSYDVTWTYGGIADDFVNVKLDPAAALVLQAHIDDPETASLNNIPSLPYLPVARVFSHVSMGSVIKLTDEDNDEMDISFSLPLITLQENLIPGIRQTGSVITGRSPVKNMEYKTGYSSSVPGGASITLNKKDKDLRIEKLPVGKYLLSFVISDIKNGREVSTHNAFFILESLPQ